MPNGSCRVTAADIVDKHTADHAGHLLCRSRIYGAVTNIAMRYCATVGGVAQVYLLQNVCVCFAARDESRVELVLIQGHIIAVNRLACRLLQSREVHHGTAHHVIHAPPCWHCLENMRL